MASFKFYLLELDGYLVGATSISCSDDADAMARAKGLLGTFYGAVEVWHGERKVGQVEAPPRAGETGDVRGGVRRTVSA